MSLCHGLSPLWVAVATAPTPAAAVLIALNQAGPEDLAVPPSGDALSKRAKRNLNAALRVLEIGPFAEPHAPSDEDTTNPALDARRTGMDEVKGAAPLTGSTMKRARVLSPQDDTQGDSQNADTGGDTRALDAALRAHAATLRRWAGESAHAEAPEAALRAVCAHVPADAAASALLPAGTGAVTAAALVRAVVAGGGGVFAHALAAGPLARLLRAQSAAVPRDLVTALEALADAHPRAALALFAAAHNRAAAPAAEALSRVAARLSAPVSRDALVAMADAVWGEHGVRVVEALVAKCRSSEDIAECLVKGLERNVTGLEKSLRFGKLLLAAVRDVPGVKEQYGAVIRNVAAQSTVFLAKRAVALLPKE